MRNEDWDDIQDDLAWCQGQIDDGFIDHISGDQLGSDGSVIKTSDQVGDCK